MKPLECSFYIQGDGPPLILIHGIGAAADAWRFAVPLLSEHFSVLTYDLRGHGNSPMPDSKFTLDDLVEDLELVRRNAGFDDIHIAGHSLGGMIGPAYARAHPERVRSLGLLSTAAFRTQEDSDKVWAVVTAMEKEGIPNVLPTLTDRWFTNRFLERQPNIVDSRLKQVIETDADVFMNVFRIYAGTEMGSWLHEIGIPSLVLTGEFDGGCNPRLNEQISNALPDSELVILPGLKHSILLEAGELVANHLIRFIASQG